MPRAAPMLSSFNSGELSPNIEGRVDVTKYASGCKTLENYIPLVQGPAKRRGGTRFVAEIKDSTSRAWLVRFEFNTQQAYQLEFGHQYIRFYTNHGQVQVSGVSAWVTGTAYTVGNLRSNGGVNYYCTTDHTSGVFATDLAAGKWYALDGTIYEIPSPWTASDLTDSNGMFGLRFVESNDIVYIVHQNYAPRKLSRYGATDWRISTLDPANGPFKTINTEETTVYSSAQTGTGITVTASASIFTASMVGSIFYIGQKSVLDVKQWEAGKSVAINQRRRSNGLNYLSLNAATTGGNKPIHTSGAVYDGDPGVQWQYEDSGWGYVKITALTAISASSLNVTAAANNGSGLVRLTIGANSFSDGDAVLVAGVGGTVEANGNWFVTGRTATTIDLRGSSFANAYTSGGTASTVPGSKVTADVIKPIPFYAVLVGNATANWAFGAWSDVEGWPSQVTFYKERLTFGRGQNVWMSVSGDYENFASKDDSNEVAATQAINLTLQSDKVNNLQWFASADSLICGTAGGEFAIQPITTNQPFGPENCTAPTISVYGSRSVVPVRIGDAILFVQRSGLKLRDVVYDYLSNKYQSFDQNVFADHVTKDGILQMVFQQEPYSVVWGVRSDGQLVAMTYSREQYEAAPFGGWHRHPLGGTNVFVESLSVIPSPAGDRDELWMIVRRTINGSTKRYIEYMVPEYRDADAQADAFYVDCGATYSGPPATIISGITWLEGQTVSILADGAVQPNRTVTGGAITLDLSASKVQVGLPCPAKLQTMRLNAGAGDGTSQGKTSRINSVSIRFVSSLGLKVGRTFSAMDEIDFRTVADGMNAPPALFSGDKRIDFNGDYSNDPWVCIEQDDPLPSTIVGIMPIVSTYDRG